MTLYFYNTFFQLNSFSSAFYRVHYSDDMLNVLAPAFRPSERITSNGKLGEIETDTIIVPRLEPMDRYGFASDLFDVSYKLFIR